MMATSEERLKILDMIQNGVISAEEGAKLLSALKTKKVDGKILSSDSKARKTIRIRVTDSVTGNAKVSVNLPIGLISAGLNIASNFIPEKENEILLEVENALKSGATGKIVDIIDHNDGDQIEIYID